MTDAHYPLANAILRELRIGTTRRMNLRQTPLVGKNPRTAIMTVVRFLELHKFVEGESQRWQALYGEGPPQAFTCGLPSAKGLEAQNTGIEVILEREQQHATETVQLVHQQVASHDELLNIARESVGAATISAQAAVESVAEAKLANEIARESVKAAQEANKTAARNALIAWFAAIFAAFSAAAALLDL